MSSAVGNDYHPGLEGVIASETAIANIEGQGGAGGLEYRGYRIEDLAGHVSYEETAFLLLHGDLPGREQLREFDARLRRSRAIPEALVTLLGQIPAHIHPMDALRTSVSVLSHFDPDVNAPPTDHAANVRKAERMIAQMATAVAYRRRISQGLPLVPPRDDLDHAANFLYMVSGKVPSDDHARGLRPLHGALHRARAQRLDVRGAGHGIHALGHLLRNRGRRRHAQGPAPRRRQ